MIEISQTTREGEKVPQGISRSIMSWPGVFIREDDTIKQLRWRRKIQDWAGKDDAAYILDKLQTTPEEFCGAFLSKRSKKPLKLLNELM